MVGLAIIFGAITHIQYSHTINFIQPFCLACQIDFLLYYIAIDLYRVYAEVEAEWRCTFKSNPIAIKPFGDTRSCSSLSKSNAPDREHSISPFLINIF